MAFDLAVGATLDDAIARLNTLVDDTLQPARDNSAAADKMVNFNQMYEGAAKAELQSFCKQYSQKIAKMSYYYYLGRRYLEMVKDELENADRMIAQYITEGG